MVHGAGASCSSLDDTSSLMQMQMAMTRSDHRASQTVVHSRLSYVPGQHREAVTAHDAREGRARAVRAPDGLHV